MLIDSTQLPDNTQLDCDLCIIGAGPAGLVLANGLIKTGLQICLVEAGGLSPQSEHAAQSLSEQLGHPVIVHPRTRYFGGMSNAWGGVRGLHVRLLPFDPIDFNERPWVPNSGWPISYRELRPFYRKACNLLDDMPMDGFDVDKQGHQLLPAFNDDVLRSRMTHLASPIRFGRRYRETLKQARNVRVLLNAYATEIEESPSENRINVIHTRSKKGHTHRVVAGTFVLACGGLETARLLLASKRKHVGGVGNQHDLVGRYYMQHPKGSHGHITLRRQSHPNSYVQGFHVNQRLMQACITLSEQRQRREGLLNHRLALAPLLQLTESRAARLYSQLRADWWEGHPGRALRQAAMAGAIGLPKGAAAICRRTLLSLPHGILHYRVINHMEQQPDPGSRVELSGETDCYGVPTLRTSWRINVEEKRSLCRLHELLGDNLRRYDIGSLQSHLNPERGDWPVSASSSHDLGTARMHNNPRHGVTDADGRVHGVQNLYVVGGALFPTGGHANPPLTIVALALRMATCLASRARTTSRALLKDKLRA